MPATSTSWKRVPFTEGVPIPYRAAFDREQFSRLKKGLIPKEMEDKWFIYYEEPNLFLHRSWKGQSVYRVTLKETENGAEVVEALLSKQVTDNVNTDHQAQLLDFIISNLLLGQKKPFPVQSDVATSKHRILQHHISGTAYPNEAMDSKKKQCP